MIIWINGAFGVGKTSTAYELHKRVPNSFVYDPENIGAFINKNIPKEIQQHDFQDYNIWRETNYHMLNYIAKEFDGVVIVPMTIVDPRYFEEIIGKLMNEGITVHHFVLSASKKTLEKRLQSRGEGKSSWPSKQIDRCIQGLSNEVFNQKIATDNRTVENIVEVIASMSDVYLPSDNRSRLKKTLDRA